MTAMLVRPRWVSPASRPRSGGTLLRLAPGIFIVRPPHWVPSTVLDRNGELPPPERPDLVLRRFPHPRWHLAAGCRSADQELFFGDEIEVAAPRRRPVLARALTWCRPCAVRVVCLAHALLTPEHSGIWGGVSARDRSLLVERIGAGTDPADLIAATLGVELAVATAAITEAVGARR